MHNGNTDATSQPQQQLEQQRVQQQGQRQAPFGGDVSQLSAGGNMSAADMLQSQQMQSQQVLAYYWQLYLTNALQQAGGQLPLPYMPGNMLGAAPFQPHFIPQQQQPQQQRDGLQQHPLLPMHMQQQYSVPTPGLNMDPQHHLLQLQQLQQFQQLSQQQSQQKLQQQQQQQNYPQLQQQIQQQSAGSRDHEDMAKRRSDDGTAAVASKKPRKIRIENKVCSNCRSINTPFWRKDRNTGMPLCNACGLYYAKNDAMRPKVLWKPEDASASSAASVKHGGVQSGGLQRSGPTGTGGTSTDPSSSTGMPPILIQALTSDSLPSSPNTTAHDQQSLPTDALTRSPGKKSSGVPTPLRGHLAPALANPTAPSPL